MAYGVKRVSAKRYMIYDLQIHDYFSDAETFTKREAIERLAEYHDGDFEDDTYLDIYSLLDTIQGEERKLEFLLDYGSWRLDPI